MIRTLRFTVIVLAIWLALLGLTLAPPSLLITGHDGDLIHTLDLVYRMAAGDRAHVDFVTPLGVLSLQPIVWFVEQGYGPGVAVRLAQAAVALALLPVIAWTALSRLPGRMAHVFAIAVVVMVMALVHGGAVPSLSLSMYYNRWAWALAAIVVLLVFLPPRPGWRAEWLDGAILGAAGALLVVVKLTFAAGLAPVALIALAMDRRWTALAAGAVAALLVLGGATATLGLAHWGAYAGDLLTVATGDLRARPGEDLGGLLAKPAFLPASFAALMAIIFWRKTGRMREGLLLLVAAPGWVYITYQNWGNDPKWLFLLAILLLALPAAPGRSFAGMPADRFAGGLALVCLTLLSPSMINIAMSPGRHLQLDTAEFAPIFDDLARDDIGVMIETHRYPRTQGRLAEIDFGPPPEDEAEADTPATFLGETLPDCHISTGLVGWLRKATAQLGAIEEAVGQPVLTADLLDALWLFGPFERMQGHAPWYYGSERGFETATHVLVPLCAMSEPARKAKLDVIAGLGWQLEEVIRTDLFILARRQEAPGR